MLLFLALLATEVLIALFVHDDFVRPYLGDVLVVPVIFFLLRAAFPERIKLLPLYIFRLKIAEHHTVSLAAFVHAALRLLPVGVSLTGNLTFRCLNKFAGRNSPTLKSKNFVFLKWRSADILAYFKIRHSKSRDFSVFKACGVRPLSAYTPLTDQIIFQFVVIKYNIIFCTSKIRP